MPHLPQTRVKKKQAPKPSYIPEPIRAEALTALRARESRTAIAHRLGVSVQWVSKLASKHGIESVNTSAAQQIRQSTYRIGAKTVSSFVLNLPEDVIEWIHRSRPKGVSFAETMRAILIDAHNDEIDAHNAEKES